MRSADLPISDSTLIRDEINVNYEEIYLLQIENLKKISLDRETFRIMYFRGLTMVQNLKTIINSGLSFFSPGIETRTSIINERGGLPVGYAHVMMALFLRNHMRNLSNFNIDFHVLFQGYKYWFPVHDFILFFRQLSKSNELDSIRRTPVPQNAQIRRICLWVNVECHTFVLCWDEILKEDPSVCKHRLALCDNLNGRGIDLKGLLDAFKICLPEAEKDNVCFRVLNMDFIKTGRQFSCVSFLARCTLILKMFESSIFKYFFFRNDGCMLPMFRAKYICFEKELYQKLRTEIESGKIALLPALLSQDFVNISRVKLEFSDTEGKMTGRYVYASDGFHLDTVASDLENKDSCRFSSSFCDAAAGTASWRTGGRMRGCRELL